MTGRAKRMIKRDSGRGGVADGASIDPPYTIVDESFLVLFFKKELLPSFYRSDGMISRARAARSAVGGRPDQAR
jgi:hypothetical protein